MIANRFLLPVLLVVATTASYFSVLSSGFISFDDPGYVYRNQHVQRGLSWAGWCYAWTSFDCGNWHPLTWLSLELDTTLWGLNPVGFHFTNLLLHALNVLLVYFTFYRMTHQMSDSACVAALFALHPLHVESVAWIAERKDVLSTFFLLMTILAYVHYAAAPKWQRYLLVVLPFVLGLLAKPTLVTLPILLLLIDSWPLNRINWASVTPQDATFPPERFSMLVLEKLPLFAIAFADGLMTIWAQRQSMGMLNDLSLDIRIGNMFYAYFWYLLKTVDPLYLTIFYPHPERDLSWVQIIGGVSLLSIISAYVIWRRRTQPHLVFGWTWFIVALLPVIGLIQVGGQAYADRYVYIPHIGLFVMAVWELHGWLKAKLNRQWIFVPVVTVVLMACALLTHRQVSRWKSNETLWTHTITIFPDSHIGYLHLGDLRWSESDFQGAIDHLTKALRLKNGDQHMSAYTYSILGKSQLALNQLPDAEVSFLAALKKDEYHDPSFEGLSTVYRMQNRINDLDRLTELRVRALKEAIDTHPDDPEKRFTLGLLMARQRKFSLAIPQFQKAIELAPQSATTYCNLAFAQARLGRFEEAKSNLLKAIKLDGTLANAHFHLAEIFSKENDDKSAQYHYAEAVRLNPADREAEQRLNQLLNP